MKDIMNILGWELTISKKTLFRLWTERIVNYWLKIELVYMQNTLRFTVKVFFFTAQVDIVETEGW